MDAIDYPTIEVGGRTLVVRCNLASQRLMTKRGVPIDKLADLGKLSPQDAAYIWLDVFTCMVDENFAPENPYEYVAGKGPTSDYWASQLAPGQLAEVCRVCNEAMGKVLEALRKTKQAATAPIPIAS